MSKVGAPERVTQERVIKLFEDELKYTYLGDWTDRPNNSNIEEDLLMAHLKEVGYSEDVAYRAIRHLWSEASNPNRVLYDNNKAVYQLLRYGLLRGPLLVVQCD